VSSAWCTCQVKELIITVEFVKSPETILNPLLAHLFDRFRIDS